MIAVGTGRRHIYYLPGPGPEACGERACYCGRYHTEDRPRCRECVAEYRHERLGIEVSYDTTGPRS